MKKRNQPKTVRHRRKGRPIQTGAVILTAIAILAGIYLLGTLSCPSPANSSSLSVSGSGASSFVSSQTQSGTPTPTLSPTPTPTLTPAPTLTTTPAPTPYSGPVSYAREGWYYTPGGSTGTLAKTTTAHVTACDRFDGIWQGDTTKKIVYITMDVGYDNNGTTAQILDILKDKNIKVTFFVTGAMFQTEALKALIQRMADEGHLVGNHTWNHPSMPIMLNEKGEAAVNAEIDKIEAAYTELTGLNMSTYMRPPMGEYSEATLQLMQRRGYKTVFWSFAYKDWDRSAQPDPGTALQTVINGLHNGVVYLLHSVSTTNVAILDDVIDEIRAQGYEFGLVSDIK